MIADRDLCLDANEQVVEAKDPAKRTFLVAKGSEIPPPMAAKYGLRDEGGKVAYGAPVEPKPALAKEEALPTTVPENRGQPSALLTPKDAGPGTPVVTKSPAKKP